MGCLQGFANRLNANKKPSYHEENISTLNKTNYPNIFSSGLQLSLIWTVGKEEDTEQCLAILENTLESKKSTNSVYYSIRIPRQAQALKCIALCDHIIS